MKLKLRIFLILTLAIFLGIGASWAFSFRDITMKFVQISDTHISDRENTSYKMLSKSKVLLADAIKQINATPNVDFVMFTGDMVDQPFYQSYKDFFTILTDLKCPSLMAFGNHDTNSTSSTDGALLPPDSLNKAQVLDIFQKANPNYKFEKSYYALSPKKDYRIIVLDLAMDKDMSSNGFISDEQLAFLDKELEENKDKVIVIFQHFPVVEPFESSHHKVLNADKYMEIIQKYKNPIAIFSGHYHSTKITKQDNVIHVSTPALVTYPNAFRLISITNYDDRTIFDFYFKETTLKDVQEEAKAVAVASSSFYGVEKDRSTTIIIKKK